MSGLYCSWLKESAARAPGRQANVEVGTLERLLTPNWCQPLLLRPATERGWGAAQHTLHSNWLATRSSQNCRWSGPEAAEGGGEGAILSGGSAFHYLILYFIYQRSTHRWGGQGHPLQATRRGLVGGRVAQNETA